MTAERYVPHNGDRLDLRVHDSADLDLPAQFAAYWKGTFLSSSSGLGNQFASSMASAARLNRVTGVAVYQGKGNSEMCHFLMGWESEASDLAFSNLSIIFFFEVCTAV